MKTTEESLQIRNHLLECMENALIEEDEEKRAALLTVTVVGGGPTGVELAGALSEMKRYILPKDYPEIDFSLMKIYLIEASDRILSAMSEMSEKSSEASTKFLENLGVKVKTNTLVEDYDGSALTIKGQDSIQSNTMIWAAGVIGNAVDGLSDVYQNGRVIVNDNCEVIGYESIYAIGDVTLMITEDFPKGHPQVAQVAMQQAEFLTKKLSRKQEFKGSFEYKDLGSMATIGRSKAVADIAKFHFNGFFAWLFWLFVHLMNILGVKNKLFIFIDWMWYYISFNQSLRLLIKPKKSPN